MIFCCFLSLQVDEKWYKTEHTTAKDAEKLNKKETHMNLIPTHKKPLIDLTAIDEADWRDEMEAEIERLNAMITRLLMQGGANVNHA